MRAASWTVRGREFHDGSYETISIEADQFGGVGLIVTSSNGSYIARIHLDKAEGAIALALQLKAAGEYVARFGDRSKKPKAR